MAGDCTSQTCPVANGYLAYEPSIVGCAILLAGFAVLVPIQAFVGFRYRTPLFAVTFAVGLILEILGYVGKILLRSDQARQSYFLLSLVGTVIGPTFTAAAIYTILPHVLDVHGQEILLFSSQPANLSPLFLVFDVVAVIFQAVGCALVIQEGNGTLGNGTKLLLVGLAVQGAGIVVFLLLHWAFAAQRSSAPGVRSYSRRRASIYSSSRFKAFLFCVQLSAALLLARTIGYMVQYSSGLSGNLAQNEIMSLVLDGAGTLLACILLTFLPPGPTFGPSWSETSPKSWLSGSGAKYKSTSTATTATTARHGEDLPLRHHRGGSYPSSPRQQDVFSAPGSGKGYLLADHQSPEATYTPPARTPPWEYTGAGAYGSLETEQQRQKRASDQQSNVSRPQGSPYAQPQPSPEARGGKLPTPPGSGGSGGRRAIGLPASVRPQRQPVDSASNLIQFTHTPRYPGGQTSVPGSVAPPRRAPQPAVGRKDLVEPDSLW